MRAGGDRGAMVRPACKPIHRTHRPTFQQAVDYRHRAE